MCVRRITAILFFIVIISAFVAAVVVVADFFVQSNESTPLEICSIQISLAAVIANVVAFVAASTVLRIAVISFGLEYIAATRITRLPRCRCAHSLRSYLSLSQIAINNKYLSNSAVSH